MNKNTNLAVRKLIRLLESRTGKKVCLKQITDNKTGIIREGYPYKDNEAHQDPRLKWLYGFRIDEYEDLGIKEMEDVRNILSGITYDETIRGIFIFPDKKNYFAARKELTKNKITPSETWTDGGPYYNDLAEAFAEEEDENEYEDEDYDF